MNRYLLAVAVCFTMSCGQSNPSAPAPVTPGTITALFSPPDGDPEMITQQDGAQRSFNAGSILTTPAGAQFSFKLPDSSTIFLNAASSVKILQFDKTKRVISLTGEAFFDVTTNPTVPFTVKTKDATITAFGTSFNVLAYPDEPRSKATLVEGALQIIASNRSISLQPGQEVTVDNLQVTNADMEKTLAWRDGYYDGSEVGSFIRQLSRWHGLTPVFNSEIPSISFEGKIPRDINLPDILTILQANGIKVVVDEKQRSLVY